MRNRYNDRDDDTEVINRDLRSIADLTGALRRWAFPKSPNDGITAKSVYKWLKDGVIPGYKIGTTWFVIRDELKDTLRKGANTKRDTGPVLVIRTETKQGD